MTCPVCGKGRYRMLAGFDGPIENPTQPVSHLACVTSQREESMLMKARYQEAEAELAALKGQIERLNKMSRDFVHRIYNDKPAGKGAFWTPGEVQALLFDCARAEEGGGGEHLTGCLCPTCKRKTGGEL